MSVRLLKNEKFGLSFSNTCASGEETSEEVVVGLFTGVWSGDAYSCSLFHTRTVIVEADSLWACIGDSNN